MSEKKKLYLANPYGFSVQQRGGPLLDLVAALEAAGAEVREPFSHNQQIGQVKPGQAYEIGQSDVEGLRWSDAIFAVTNGCPPDEGVMVELGIAIGWRMPTFLFRDDFRHCADTDTYPLNLMLFTGLPKQSWKDYWYESVDEIADPKKALVRWLKGELPDQMPEPGILS